jgi:HPr Serine kinase C-terminal domain
MKSSVKYYQAAGITVQVNSDFSIAENTFHSKFKQFEKSGLGEDNITIHHHFYLPDLSQYFDSSEKEIYKNEHWHILQTKNCWIYKYQPSPTEESGFPVIGLFNHDHSVIKVYSPGIDETRYKKGNFGALTLFNTDQILFSKLLCKRKGLITHSNGFDISGNGILLTGESGAGKSTLSKMLKNKGFEILCDDRMFIQQKEKFYIYGNWCHGTVPDVSSAVVPLNAILFLEKSNQNSIQKIDNKNLIFKKMMTSLVRSFLDREELNLILTTLETVVKQTTCYNIKFDLSGEICDLIEDLFINDKNADKNDH